MQNQKEIDEKIENGEAITEEELGTVISNSQELIEEDNSHKWKNRRMAIMTNVKVGLVTVDGKPVTGLSFVVNLSEETKSNIFFSMEQLSQLLIAESLEAIAFLENKPCWVYEDKEKNVIVFLGVFKP